MPKITKFDPHIDCVSGTDLSALQRAVKPWMDVEWLEADWIGGETDGVCGAGVRLVPKHRLFLVHAEAHRPIPPQMAAEARRVSNMYRLLAEWLEELPDDVAEWELTDEERIDRTDARLMMGYDAR